MAMIHELRRRARRALAPVLAVCAVAYFGYHAVEGRYGLLSWYRLSVQITALEDQAAMLEARREGLERRVALLKPDHLDPDLLDEEVRRTLGFVAEDEVIIFHDLDR